MTGSNFRRLSQQIVSQSPWSDLEPAECGRVENSLEISGQFVVYSILIPIIDEHRPGRHTSVIGISIPFASYFRASSIDTVFLAGGLELGSAPSPLSDRIQRRNA